MSIALSEHRTRACSDYISAASVPGTLLVLHNYTLNELMNEMNEYLNTSYFDQGFRIEIFGN